MKENWEWDNERESKRERGTVCLQTEEIINKHALHSKDPLQVFRDPPPTHKQFTVCTAAHTHPRLQPKLAREMHRTESKTEMVTEGRQRYRHWERHQALMSQWCVEPDHTVQTNTIWKPESVTVIMLFL